MRFRRKMYARFKNFTLLCVKEIYSNEMSVNYCNISFKFDHRYARFRLIVQSFLEKVKRD